VTFHVVLNYSTPAPKEICNAGLSSWVPAQFIELTIFTNYIDQFVLSADYVSKITVNNLVFQLPKI
jgi:hypothetical protein